MESATSSPQTIANVLFLKMEGGKKRGNRCNLVK
jgi:hypothetical protein